MELISQVTFLRSKNVKHLPDIMETFNMKQHNIFTIIISLLCLHFVGCSEGNVLSDSIHFSFQIGSEVVILPYWILILCVLFLTFYIWYKRKFKPLHYAAIKGNPKDIESLIDKGVDVDIKNRAGLTVNESGSVGQGVYF